MPSQTSSSLFLSYVRVLKMNDRLKSPCMGKLDYVSCHYVFCIGEDMDMSGKIELLPDPIRMVEGLRDTGYQFNTAVADVIDNSIAAAASFVVINLNMDFRGQLTLEIFDNGIGMNRDELVNAMKYGSNPRPSPASLGKFGLGLKTASTAFCRQLSLVSRREAGSPLLKATWDLDHIRNLNKWELIVEEPDEEEIEAFNRVIGESSGTLVVWRKIDRLLKNYATLGGSAAQKALQKIVQNLHFHLGMIFQRFLDKSDTRTQNVKMSLNGLTVDPWDPFCVDESLVVSEDNPVVELPDGNQAGFSMKAYVLPRKEEFSSDGAAKAARITNTNQGIYIYRENRLIHGPDWLTMFAKEPHLSLLRVEFSFNYLLDDAFQIDIKKSQIILNEALYDHIVDFMNPPRRAAEEAYRKGRKAKTADVAKTAHDSSNKNIQSKEKELSKPEITSVDKDSGEVELTNTQGSIRLKLKISSATKPQEIFVQPTDSIDDGLLWEPCLIDGHNGVRINTGHPYYSKVYIPNLAEGVTIQGMDALLWGIAVAELNCISDTTRSSFAELRYEVSRNLRKLVQDLPDPKAIE